MASMPMVPAIPMPVRVPGRVAVLGGITVVVRLAVPVDITVIIRAAAAGHLDNVRHRRGAGLCDRGGGVRRHRSGAQSQGTEQRQNCCTHRGRPSKRHRNNDARGKDGAGRRFHRVKPLTDAEEICACLRGGACRCQKLRTTLAILLPKDFRGGLRKDNHGPLLRGQYALAAPSPARQIPIPAHRSGPRAVRSCILPVRGF